jgi:rhodanese-related sulfurtransferase
VAGICILILLIVTLPRLRSWLRGRGRPVLDPVQAEELIMGPGALVVDLRDPEAFRTGHIRGCLHVPFGDLATHLLRPDPAAKRALILVDETDLLAHQAFDLLTARGFTWMYVMKGGMHAWKRANQPLTK